MAGQFVSRAYVVLLRKSIPQRATYKLPLCLALCVKSANFANPNEMEKEDSEKRCIVISGSYVGRLRKQRHAEFL